CSGLLAACALGRRTGACAGPGPGDGGPGGWSGGGQGPSPGREGAAVAEFAQVVAQRLQYPFTLGGCPSSQAQLPGLLPGLHLSERGFDDGFAALVVAVPVGLAELVRHRLA